MKRNIEKVLLCIILIGVVFFAASCGGGGSVYVSGINLVYPALNNVFGVPVNAVVRWNSQNIVSVEVFLGETENGLQKKATIVANEFDLSALSLSQEKAYFLKLVARDSKGNEKNTPVIKFTTESAKASKDNVLESIKNSYNPVTIDYIQSSEFSNVTGCGTITVHNVGEHTVKDIWNIMGENLKNNEDIVFPVEVTGAGNLSGIYQYYDSRVYNITIDTTYNQLEALMAANNNVEDNDSIIFKLIYETFPGLKLNSAIGQTIVLNLELQSQQYKLYFVIKQ